MDIFAKALAWKQEKKIWSDVFLNIFTLVISNGEAYYEPNSNPAQRIVSPVHTFSLAWSPVHFQCSEHLA
jgi:hypothetical protein